MPVKHSTGTASRSASRAGSPVAGRSAKPAPATEQALPRLSYRPPTQAPVAGGQAVARLWRWLPLQVFCVAALALAGWMGWRAVEYQRHAVPGSVVIDTAGAKGSIANGLLSVKLPVAVFNGAQSPVLSVTLWVDIWACPAQWSPQDNCRKLLTTSQDLPMQVAHGGQAHMTSSYEMGVGDRLDGDFVRIERHVDAIKTEADIPPPDMPPPNLNEPD